MSAHFDSSGLSHVAGFPGAGDAATRVVSAADFAEAVAEITQWEGYAPTHVFAQGGVGGLAASVAAGLRQYWGAEAPRVVVAEPELAACLFESARAGTMTSVQIEEETVMAGLSCGEPSEMAWEILSQEASDFLALPDRFVGPAVRLLARPAGNDPGIEAGESAVAGLAALIAVARCEGLRGTLGLDANSRVLLIGSEGVTDRQAFAGIMEAGGKV